MKHIRLILLSLYLLAFHAGAAGADREIELQALFKGIDKSDIVIEVTLTNQSKKPIYLPSFKNVWIEVSMGLWVRNKGVILYPDNDAVWRRNDAFIDYRWTKLEPGDRKTVKLHTDSLLPNDSDDDQFAKALIKEAVFLRSGKSEIYVQYKEAPEAEAPIHNLNTIVEFDAASPLPKSR